MDDPGWGEYVPVPEDEKSPKQPARRPSSGPTGGGPRGGGKGGFSIGPLNGPMLIGAAVLVVAVIVGVVLKVSSGSDKKAVTTTTTTQTTTSTPTTTTQQTTTTPEVKKKPKPVVTTNPNFLVKATYIKRADAICKAYKSSITTAENAENVQLTTTLIKREVAELEKLKPPDQDASTMNRALQDAEGAIIALQEGDLTTANKDILATDTLVGLFGMHVCNYGH
jgi:hypothetical protein